MSGLGSLNLGRIFQNVFHCSSGLEGVEEGVGRESHDGFISTTEATRPARTCAVDWDNQHDNIRGDHALPTRILNILAHALVLGHWGEIL
jgi:hypothetical protein